MTKQCATCRCDLNYPTATHIIDCSQPAPKPQLFHLERVTDITGISGTGIVAEGIQFSDGTVALRWLDTGVSTTHRERSVRPTTVVHESVESVTALHGHNGATRVVWKDPAHDREVAAEDLKGMSKFFQTAYELGAGESDNIAAQVVHEAGYRCPRVITTLEELEALQDQAVILSTDLEVLICVGKTGSNLWADAWGTWIESVLVTLPARVFWDPTP